MNSMVEVNWLTNETHRVISKAAKKYHAERFQEYSDIFRNKPLILENYNWSKDILYHWIQLKDAYKSINERMFALPE